jgi:endonuclease G
MKFSRLSLLLVTLVLFVVSCKKSDPAPPAPTPGPGGNTVVEDDPLYLGNPTNAQNSTAYPENYLKNSVYYTIAYSRSRSIPVWVAWHLQSEDQGGIPRQDDFRADTELPAGWYQVQSSSFSGSGFDRGHNCPSADRTRSVAANSSTFLMTNMIPQSPNLNQGPWEGLEDYIRNSLLGTTNEAYVYMGNFGSGGYNSSNSLFTTINNGNVVVPAKVWKVVVVLPKGSNDKARLSSNTIVLAVDMPNDNRLYTTSNKTAWRNYLCTVSSLEAEANSTGVPLNLFQDVVDSLRPVLKAKLFQ